MSVFSDHFIYTSGALIRKLLCHWFLHVPQQCVLIKEPQNKYGSMIIKIIYNIPYSEVLKQHTVNTFLPQWIPGVPYVYLFQHHCGFQQSGNLRGLLLAAKNLHVQNGPYHSWNNITNTNPWVWCFELFVIKLWFTEPTALQFDSHIPFLQLLLCLGYTHHKFDFVRYAYPNLLGNFTKYFIQNTFLWAPGKMQLIVNNISYHPSHQTRTDFLFSSVILASNTSYLATQLTVLLSTGPRHVTPEMSNSLLTQASLQSTMDHTTCQGLTHNPWRVKRNFGT